MTITDRPWEPPLAGTETEHLLGALDRLRTTFRWKTDALDAAGLQARIGASSLTLGSLLKHLARAEDEMFSVKLSGAPVSPPWDTVDWDADPDWEWRTAHDDTPSELLALFDEAVRRADDVIDEALTGVGLDSESHEADRREGTPFSLRRIIVHMIEEYARHNGHADLIRQSIDGATGE
jgi:Protein of unknown function (DUF664)